MKTLKQNELKNIEQFTGELPNLPVSKKEEQLQRTAEWYEARRGLVTGSKVSDLMKCDRSASKKEWGVPEKTIALGDAAKKYIFEKAMERKTGKVIETPDTFTMRYGRAAEPVIKEMLLKTDYCFDMIDESFIPVPEYENYIGASPDGLFVHKAGDNYALEIKAPTSFTEMYNRIITDINDEKHPDFWQLQTEMLALNVDRAYYVVAYPPASILDFMNAESQDDQMEMIGSFDIKEVQASEVHQTELLKRAMICKKIGDMVLQGVDFTDATNKILAEGNF